MADFSDLALQYLGNRFNSAIPDLNTNVGNQANVKPVSTTINYGDNGEQTVTTKHEVTPNEQPNYLAQGYTPPTTPAVGGQQPTFNFMPQGMPQGVQPGMPAPVAPPVAPPAPPVQQQMQQSMAQPVAAPVAPAVPKPIPMAAPQQQGQPIRDDTGAIVGYETPQQMLGNMQQGLPVGANPATQRINPQGQAIPPVAPVNPAAPNPIQTVPGVPETIPQLQQTAEAAPPKPLDPYQQALIDAQKDPQKLNAYIANENAPKELRGVATDLLKQHYRREEEDAQREKLLKGLTSDNPREQSDAIKKLRSKGEEGSLFKAYIFNRLGLTDLAQQEQAKIAGPKFERSMLDGQSYLTEVNSKGGIVTAYDSAGRAVDDATLAKLNAGATKFGTQAYGFTGGSITIPEGQPNAGQEYRQRTNAQTGAIENVITTGPDAGKLYTGAPGYEKRVGSQYLISQNNMIMDLLKKNNYNVLDAWKDFQLRNGPHPELQEEFFQKYGYLKPGSAVNPAKPIVPPVVNPNQKMSLPSENQGAGMMTTGYNPNEAQGGMMTTGLVDQPLIQSEIKNKLQEKGGTQAIESQGAGATETAKSKAKRTEALPSREDDARRVLRTINEVVNHPGFEISTGMTQPIGSLLSMIPGTDARDWRAKYKELQGQNFLEAYANLRGTGSISEKEGAKAESAIAALSDPCISESEFKRNAELLKNDVKRRINTERKSLGMKPLDWDQVEIDMKKETMSPRDRDALDWAEKNPKDPRAADIRKRLGM